ncbi:MAG: hypothetical protein GX254_00460 [Clostridiales bacterium]|jgi:uncharacterized protein YkwD|nr:hypothetical protein [Clostridiales bacterium]
MRKRALYRANVLILAFILCFSCLSMGAFANETAPGEDDVGTFKARVVELVNAERAKEGLAELLELETLTAAADLRAYESAQSFSHTRPNGQRCFTVFSEYSMKYKAAGENLAYGFKTPEAMIEAWMNSESHRANILDPDFTYIGIGYYVNENGRGYYSQLFYTPSDSV